MHAFHPGLLAHSFAADLADDAQIVCGHHLLGADLGCSPCQAFHARAATATAAQVATVLREQRSLGDLDTLAVPLASAINRVKLEDADCWDALASRVLAHTSHLSAEAELVVLEVCELMSLDPRTRAELGPARARG